MHLLFNFYIAAPPFSVDVLDALQLVINELLPQWSRELRVGKYEDSDDCLTVGRNGRLYDAVHRAAPPKRRLGKAVFTGAYEGLSFFVDHLESAYPPELNVIDIEVYLLPLVEGRSTSHWARELFEAMALRLPIRYAKAHTSEEYHAKNMVDDESGVRAIGADLKQAIPGLYWLSYFGPLYVELIGRDKLLTAPAYEVKPIGDGVLIALDPEAEAWQSAGYREREGATISHLGEQFFFSRLDPKRLTVAPDYRGERKSR